METRQSGAMELWWNVFASKACQLCRALGSVMVRTGYNAPLSFQLIR